MTRKVRRSEFVFFYHQNTQVLDTDSLLDGQISFTQQKKMIAFPILYGKKVELTDEEYAQLIDVPTAQWIGDFSELQCSDALVRKFTANGILLVDSEEEQESMFLKREHILKKQKWDMYTAFYHFFTKHQDVDLEMHPADFEGEESKEKILQKTREVIDRQGVPPAHFFEVATDKVIQLPMADQPDDLFYQIVTRRRTCRLFSHDHALPVQTLSRLLFYTFGCQGVFEFHPKMKVLKKTVPSGGALHPTECFALCLNVEGIASGLYHYNVEHHELHQIQACERTEGMDMAAKCVRGQNFIRDANVVIMMTTRYFRNYWKYREHAVAYRVTMMDAGHLSQMFYLNCAKEGVGAFVSCAIDATYLEDILEIDGYEHGATLVIGCGIPESTERGSHLELPFNDHNITR